MLYWVIGIPLVFLALPLGLAAICACMLSSRISRDEEEKLFHEYHERRERGFDLSEAELTAKK